MDFKSYYDEKWLARASYFSVHRLRFLQTWDFAQKLSLPRTGQVLDVGGVGPLSAYLSEVRGWSCAETGSDLRYPLQDVPPDYFDLVLCTETIEHIKDRETHSISELEAFNYSGILSLLQELRRVVKPVGSLILSTPNANSYITLQKWLFGEVLLMDPRHVREFSMRDLSRVVCESSLHVLMAETINSWDEIFGDSVQQLRSGLGKISSFGDVERGDNLLIAARKA